MTISNYDWCYPTWGQYYPTSSKGWSMEELHGDPTAGSHPKFWTRGKNGRGSPKVGVERLRYGTIQKEVS